MRILHLASQKRISIFVLTTFVRNCVCLWKLALTKWRRRSIQRELRSREMPYYARCQGEVKHRVFNEHHAALMCDRTLPLRQVSIDSSPCDSSSFTR
jgi:hypothetical protein